MFGKPEWFRDKTFRWGLTPVTWQGWVYTGAWFTALSAPFLLLMTRGNFMGAWIWMAVGIAGLIYDVWLIKRARHAPPPAAAAKKEKESILYIGDDDVKNVSTKNLDLQLRR